MKKENEHYLNELISFLKMNPKMFSESLGFKRTDKIYHVLNGRNGISSELAKQITDIYTDVSYDWLLTGSGGMLKSQSKDTQISIPSSVWDVIERQSKSLEGQSKALIESIKEKDSQMKALADSLKEKDSQMRDLVEILKNQRGGVGDANGAAPKEEHG